MTRITRSMYHADLQSTYRLGKIVTWMAQRNWGLRLMHRLLIQPLVGSKIDGMVCDEIYIPSVATPGHKIRARIYKPAHAKGPLPAMLYAHGGGYEVGVPEQAHPFFKDILERRDVAIVAPAYRLSLQGHPYPHGLNDCYDTLLHMKAQAADLGIRSDAFIVAGHSGGGGMAAAVTLKAVDTGSANIAFQMPIYPMIDHRMETPSARDMVGTAVWDRGSNALAWQNYLGHLEGDIPDYASPALRKDLSDMPPTISFVGDLEPFKDETLRYMDALKRDGVPTKFELYRGAFHGFETIAPKAALSQAANEFQVSAFAAFYDRYL
ncbi:MAG: alpha/beta hydrolase [Pseudomonadota bacterium]